MDAASPMFPASLQGQDVTHLGPIVLIVGLFPQRSICHMG